MVWLDFETTVKTMVLVDEDDRASEFQVEVHSDCHLPVAYKHEIGALVTSHILDIMERIEGEGSND